MTNAYERVRTGEQVVQLYDKGYLQQASHSLEITPFSYEHGATSLLDFLDAERSYRSTELSYWQALATHMTALEQLRSAWERAISNSIQHQPDPVLNARHVS